MGIEITIDSMPIKDTWIPTRKAMGEILGRIDGCIKTARPAYVHCWAAEAEREQRLDVIRPGTDMHRMIELWI